MALNPGDLAIVAVLGNSGSGGSGDELIRVLATTDIAEGEVVRIYEGTSSTADYIEFTVGVGGVSEGSVLTFVEQGDTVSVDGNATAGVVDGATGNPGSGSDFATNASNDISLVSDGEVIWGIDFDGTFSADHSSVADATAHNLTADPVVILENPEAGATGSGAGENWVFQGTTYEQLDDPAFYAFDSSTQDFNNVNINGTTFGSGAAADTQQGITCFAPGTGIATPSGETCVEDLQVGDIVRTADGRDVPVVWIGRQTVMKQFAREAAQLVRISKGTLGAQTDLFVTGDHGMVVDGYVVNASALVNGSTVSLVPLHQTPDRFTVYHVETADHEVLLANGVAAESFVDYLGRRVFDNFSEVEERVISEMPLPRISAQRLLPASIRAKLSSDESETRLASGH